MIATAGWGRAVDALAAAAAVGPYFAVELGEPDEPGWRPFTDLLDHRATLGERVAFVRSALAARTGVSGDELDRRACASIYFLGVAARLVAPSLAAVTLRGVLPTTTATDLRWRRVDGGPVPVAWSAVAARPAGNAREAGQLLHDHVVVPLVTPLVAAFATASGVAVSPIVLWGNVASALAGAACLLLGSDAPFVLDPAAVARVALSRGQLAGTGTFDRPDRFFGRTSCCLFYRIPGGGTCGDCVLRQP